MDNIAYRAFYGYPKGGWSQDFLFRAGWRAHSSRPQRLGVPDSGLLFATGVPIIVLKLEKVELLRTRELLAKQKTHDFSVLQRQHEEAARCRCKMTRRQYIEHNIC